MCKILAALLFFVACSKFEKIEAKKIFFDSALTSVFEITNQNEKILGLENPKLPPGAWLEALTLKAYHNDFKIREYCLMVKASMGMEKGEVKVVAKDNKNQACDDLMLKKAMTQSVRFFNLLVELKENKLSIKADKESFAIEFPNLEAKKRVLVSTPSSVSWKIEDYLNDGELCLKVSDDCSKSSDNCSKCRNGYYNIKDNKCANGYSKICGEDKCGLKGMPACIRGQIATGVEDYCINDSPVGFCLNGNRVGCVNGKLICE